MFHVFIIILISLLLPMEITYNRRFASEAVSEIQPQNLPWDEDSSVYSKNELVYTVVPHDLSSYVSSEHSEPLPVFKLPLH